MENNSPSIDALTLALDNLLSQPDRGQPGSKTIPLRTTPDRSQKAPALIRITIELSHDLAYIAALQGVFDASDYERLVREALYSKGRRQQSIVWQ